MKISRCFPLSLLLLPCLSIMMVSTASALDYSTLVQSVEPERAARYKAFRNFQIKGICGTARLDLATAYGANTIRTYVPPSREQLDEYQKMGLKVVVGIWMPNQGENRDKKKGKWNYDYNKGADNQVKSFAETVDRIGDHPAILLWCLGNEVHLDPLYLTTVNRMSELLHKKHPKQLSSLTMINAQEEKIALIKQYAPDLDVIGYNSYGAGAVKGASQRLEQQWGRAYYVSEFGPGGPWWGRKTAWGVVYEQSYDVKLGDLRKSFESIDAAPRCLGSTMFLWGYWSQQIPTYFSAFLTPEGIGGKPDDQKLYITPMAEEFCHYWSGKYPAQRGPVLTKIGFADFPDKGDAIFQAGQRFTVTAAAQPGSTSKLSYRWWIVGDGKGVAVGPINTDQPTVELEAPQTPGDKYDVMAFVIADDQLASGFTVPIKVEAAQSAAAPLEPSDSPDAPGVPNAPAAPTKSVAPTPKE
jgi:hypothetical protein